VFLTKNFKKIYALHNVFDAWQVYCQGVEGNVGRARSAGKAGKQKNKELCHFT